jgi:hypothetical protein
LHRVQPNPGMPHGKHGAEFTGGDTIPSTVDNTAVINVAPFPYRRFGRAFSIWKIR